MKKAQEIIAGIRAGEAAQNAQDKSGSDQPKPSPQSGPQPPAEEHKGDKENRASHIDKDVLKSIEETILDSSPDVKWDDVKGLSDVKKIL